MLFEEKAQVDFRKGLKQRNICRLVQTIMVRTQRPIVLTGGPFYVLSLETFRVVSIAYDLYTVSEKIVEFIHKFKNIKFLLQIMGMAMSNSLVLRTISDLDWPVYMFLFLIYIRACKYYPAVIVEV